MTLPASRDVARAALWFALIVNASGAVVNVWREQSIAASVSSLVLVAVALQLWLAPLVSDRLEANLGEAIAERKMRELALVFMEQQVRAGHASVHIKGEADRVN